MQNLTSLSSQDLSIDWSSSGFADLSSLQSTNILTPKEGGFFAQQGWHTDSSRDYTFVNNVARWNFDCPWQFEQSNNITSTVQTALQKLWQAPNLQEKLNLAFGNTWDFEVGKSLLGDLAAGQNLPQIEILPRVTLQAAGAFGANTIFLSQDLFDAPQVDIGAAANVLAEELGHYIDARLNTQDSPGDEGAIFAKLLQDQPFQAGELAALKAENDEGTLSLNGQSIPVEHADLDPGIFLVDDGGQVSINFLADAGNYQSEMAVFSLEGLTTFIPGSLDYIREVARRALSNSNLGYVVIVDPKEGAKFTGDLGESNHNEGGYAGAKIFNFTAGDRVALMLVPQGTVQEVFDNPAVGGNKQPLFSIAVANPGQETQMGQLVAGTFGWEDLQVDQGADADYNDIVFQIEGATGSATSLTALIAPNREWRNTALAQEMIAFATSDQTAPTLTADLLQDTGSSSSDRLTNNPQIVGKLTDASSIGKFQAKFGDGADFVDVLPDLQADGSFTFDRARLAQIKGGTVSDGLYQLNLQAEKKRGNAASLVQVAFTLDSTKPVAATEVKLKDDLDGVTGFTTPTFTGKAETGTTVEVLDGTTKLGEAIAVEGAWEITTVPLTDGSRNITVQSIDLAGNSSDPVPFSLTVDTVKPVAPSEVKIENDTDLVTNIDIISLLGKAEIGSTVQVFEGSTKVGEATAVDGNWKIKTSKLTEGTKSLTVKSIDVAGNLSDQTTFSITIDTTPPASLGFMLDAGYDSAPIGNGRTSAETIAIIGKTEANATLTLQETGFSVVADTQGKFKFTNVALALGNNTFTVNSIDLAGNQRSQTGTIERVEQDANDVVLEWNANLLNAVYEDKTAPPLASRNMAMVQSAVFDAVNSFSKNYQNYHFAGAAPLGASVEAAAASAAYNVLLNLYSKQKTFLDNAFTASLANITDGAAEDAGVLFGKAVADDILAFRSNDGSSQNVAFTPTSSIGDWQPTSPDFAPALLPQWGSVTPFGLTSGDQFRPAGPLALTSEQYATELNQVKELGRINSTTRTTEQTQIAQFWADGAGTFTPPGHWNQIAENVAVRKGNSLLENARLFALLNISLADAGIAAWGAKYQYNAWRPVTAIRQADADGNANTTADPNWLPLITTPPFPEYISGHSTFSGAAATVLTALVGDNIGFSINSLGLPGVDRTFTNFNEAANEAGISRIYGGIHFNTANLDGLATGKSIANYALQNLLTGADRIKPAAPVDIRIKDTIGTIVSISTPTLTGKAEADSVVQVFEGATKIGEAVSSNGIWEITTSPLTDGAKNLTLTATDRAGNVSDSQQLVMAIDTTPIQQLSITPGAQLKLEAKDIFGKNAIFSLESVQPLPIGTLDSDGTLTFAPKPTQQGTYNFTLVARDGEQVTTKRFSLTVVEDPDTTTRISGLIQNTDQKALAGVVVNIGTIMTTTASDGSFTLILAEPPAAGAALIIQPGQQVDNVVYPSIAEKLPLLLGHDVYANVKNVIDRPIFLPPIDIGNAKNIDPAITQTVTSAAIPGSAVVVAANTLFDENNQPYRGKLSITTVPTELTPAALPDNLRPDLVVTIQPGEMQFATPAPLSLPNIAGYAAGTKMDLWSINPQTGFFDNVGVGQVSADGKVINTISGGIRNSSWHFFAPPPPTANDPNSDPRNPEQGCDGAKATAPSNSDVELYSGAEIETHNLVAYQSLGVSRVLTLRYDSERADARPIVHFGYSNVQANPNLRLMADLTIRRGDFTLEVPGFAGGQYGLKGGENFWSIPMGGGKIDAALQADLRSLDSGRYDYDLTTGLVRFNNNQFNGSTSASQGKLLVVNTVNSAFGSGWGLAGLQELVSNPDGSVLIIDGDGSELLFERDDDSGKLPHTGGTYKSPVGHFSTLEQLDNGTFRHTTKEQTVYSFDVQNRLVEMRDRVGNQTTYSYQNGLLTKIVDPVGLETTFTYSGNKITAITDPAGRVTKLTYDVHGNLLKITDPDGSSKSWEYDTAHHMTAGTDQRGNRGQTFYNFAGRVTSAIMKDGATVKFDPIEVQGLYEPSRTSDPLNAPLAFQLGSATSTYTDANGKKIINTLDRAGQVVSSADEIGLLPSVKRNSDNLVTQQTDARGNTTLFTYDAKGNILTTQDPLSFASPSGGKILVLGSEGDSSVTNLKTLFQEAGLSTAVATSIPTSLTEFSQIWDMRVDNSQSITDTQSGQYLSYLKSGGRLFVVGENSNFATRNSSMLGLIEKAGGGKLNFSDLQFTQTVLSPFNNPNNIPDGNVTYGGIATGGVTTPGTGRFVTVDASGRGSAVNFDKGNLTNAPQGELTAIFDSNFFIDASTQPDSQNLLRNLIQVNRVRSQFAYDPKFNQLVSKTDELGHQTLYQIDPNNGNLLSLTQVVGAVGGDDDLVSRFTYTDKGLIDTITDSLGRVTDEDYDAQGRLITITYAKGTADEAVKHFEYNSAGNQTAIVDEKGNRTLFEYDARNRLVKTIEADPDGAGPLTAPISTFSYDASGNLLVAVDALGRVTQNTYDRLNRLIQSIDALNQKTSYSYDALSNLTSVVDALGHRTDTKYDARNRMTEKIDPEGNSIRTSYDLSNNLVSSLAVSTSRENRNNVLVANSNGEIGVVKTATSEFQKLLDTGRVWNDIAFSSEGKLFGVSGSSLSQIDAKNGSVTLVGNLGVSGINALAVAPNNELYGTGGSNFYSINAQTGAATLIKNLGSNFSSSGDIVFDPTRSIFWASSASGSTDTLFSIALDGTAVSIGKIGFASVFGLALDEAGNLLGYTDNGKQLAINKATGIGTLQRNIVNSGGSIINGSAQFITGNLSTFAYDARNRLVGETDASGNVNQYRYNAANNVIAKTDRNGRQTQYSYDDLNRRVGTLDAINRTTSSSYDGVGNITTVTDELGRITKYTYDQRNRQKTIIDPLGGTKTFSYDLVGNLLSTTDELNRTSTYSYDALNRAIKSVDPLGHSTSTVYDGVDNVISVTDAIGQTNSYGYDALNRRIKVTDAKGQVTTTDYDAVGNISAITDSVANKTSYAYDANDRLVSTTNALGKTSSYQYDFASNRVASTDRNGRVRKFTYDKLNRQVGEQWLDASNASIYDSSYSYDAVGNLLSAGDPNSKYAYLYDTVNRLTSVDNKNTAGVPNVLLNYSYDGANNLLKVTDTINGQLKGDTSYGYDALNRATSLTQTGDGLANKRVDMTYDAASQMTGLSRFADLAGLNAVAASTYIYDVVGRLTNLNHKRGDKSLAAYGYVYDEVDRVTQTTSIDGVSSYTYDTTNQLTSTDHSYQADEAYSYDANGNRTNSGYSTGKNNQLLSDGTYSYEYDAEGNRTKRTEVATGKVTEYVWDYRNRLMKVGFKDAGGNEVKTVEYAYDLFDRRIAKQIDGVVQERYVYEEDNIALIFDGQGQQTHRYLYGTGVDQVLADERADRSVVWALTDNQGTVRDLLDGNGVIMNHITYDSFGKVVSQTSNLDFRYGYTGREQDNETGLDYYRARYYDPAVGQFIAEDPLGFGASDTNFYRYVGNSPTNFTDPSGEFFFLPLLAIAAVGFVAGTGFSAVRQGLEIAEGSRKEFSIQEALFSGAIGAVAAPVLTLVPELIIPLTIKGAIDGANNMANCKPLSGAFDIISSVLPFGSSKFRSQTMGQGTLFGQMQGLGKSASIAERVARIVPPQQACFVAGTEILTQDGEKRIEDIQVGDWVLSDDPNTPGEIEYKQVLKTFVKTTTSTIDLYIDGEKITTTEEHPFWVPEVGWVAAKDLHAGTYLQTKTESWLDIDAVDRHTGSTQVYNFEVAGFHTYFVSDLGFLVHNTCDGLTSAPNPALEGNPYHPEQVKLRQQQWQEYFGISNDAIIPASLQKQLPKLVGQADFKKFNAALSKGIVGPVGKSGIKILDPPVNDYTHELKIGGSAQRILGKVDDNGVLVFDKFVRGGLH